MEHTDLFELDESQFKVQPKDPNDLSHLLKSPEVTIYAGSGFYPDPFAMFKYDVAKYIQECNSFAELHIILGKCHRITKHIVMQFDHDPTVCEIECKSIDCDQMCCSDCTVSSCTMHPNNQK